jgi:hypothetical protein
MKALSFKDPWGWLVAKGLKDVDNRTWPTNYRGRIFVHVSKTFDWDGLTWILANDDLPLEVRRLVAEMDWPQVSGAIIGEVDITGCIFSEKKQPGFSPWFTGPYGFTLANPKLYKVPIVCKGRLGFFEPKINFLEAVR